MAMTIEQQRALALAKARLRLQQSQEGSLGLDSLNTGIGSLGADAEIGSMTPDVTVHNRAIQNRERLPWWGKPLLDIEDVVGLAANGITYGFGDMALAKVDELVGRGTYDQRLAKRRQDTEDARTRAGVKGAIAEIGGSVLPAAKAAQLGLSATRIPGVVGKYGGMALDGLGFGALTAVGNDQDVLGGAAIGGALGAGGQAAGAVLGPIVKPFAARLNPQKATQEVMLKAMNEAGTNPQALADDLMRARADGQTEYALMDAMGKPGQRLASTVARTPSEGRTPMVDFLEKRQAGQGRRISTTLSEGFDTATAAQKVKALTEARKTAGDVNYTAARDEAGFVNTSNIIKTIDEKIGVRPAPSFSSNPISARVQAKAFRASPIGDGVGQDSIGQSLVSIRKMLAGKNGVQRMDFNKLLSVRRDLGDEATKAFRAGANAKGAAIANIVTQLDAALADASKGYKKALTQYRADSKVIEAVDTGRNASRRGRTEDTIPAFNALTDAEKSAYRVGYVDPLIESVQGAAVGANKVRPLINDAFEQEFPAFAAPGKGPQMGRRIAREKTMFDTLSEALGGSKTANNMADEADLSAFDPSIWGNVLTGNLTGAAKNAVLQGMSALAGQPASVRKMLSEALRVTDPNIALQNLNQAVAQINASQQQKQAIVRALMLLGTAGAVQSQK